MLASRRAAVRGASLPGLPGIPCLAFGRAERSAPRKRLFFAARAAGSADGDVSRPPPAPTDIPTQPPSDPSAFLRSLNALGGKHALFGRWFADRVARLPDVDGKGNGAYVHPSLEARIAPGAGVGVFAASAIPPGHVLIRAPSALFESLSAAHAEATARRRAPEFVQRCESACAALGAPSFAPHALLALHVLLELGDARSTNAGYLASLPSLEPNDAGANGDEDVANATSVPLLWDARRMATLRGTPTFAAVASRRAFAEALHAALFGEDATAAAVPLARFKWALSTILSRATSGARAPYALTPGVDLFNHGGAAANCALEAEPEPRRRIEATTTTSAYASVAVSCVAGASQDAQLTISYGDTADNDRLLRVYGFALPGNPNDRRELRLRVEGAALESWRAFERFGPGVLLARRAILRKHGLPRLAPFETVEAAAVAATSGGEDVAKAAEKALGGGVAFRDPGDFRSAAIDAEGDAVAKTTAATSSRTGEAATESTTTADPSENKPVAWTCFVAHPAAAPFPARRSAPMDSASPEAERACDVATAAARGVGGGAVSADALLASVRAHLLTGTEPPGPDGHEPDPWDPVSEMNEAATRAVVGEAAYAALRAHAEALRPLVGGAVADFASEAGDQPENTSESDGGFDPFAAPPSDPAAALSPAAAAGARADLAGGEAWARSVLALRRGQEEILEHVLGRSSV